MAVGLLLLTFFAFDGISGNETENNVNIFFIVNFNSNLAKLRSLEMWKSVNLEY